MRYDVDDLELFELWQGYDCLGALRGELVRVILHHHIATAKLQANVLTELTGETGNEREEREDRELLRKPPTVMPARAGARVTPDQWSAVAVIGVVLILVYLFQTRRPR